MPHAPGNSWRCFAPLNMTAVLIAALLSYASAGGADDFLRVDAAARPIADGVPQVAVHRLQQLLTESLSPNEKQLATEKLGEALCLAGRAAEALNALDAPGLTN